MTSRWEPLLWGDDADRALALVDAIARDVQALEPLDDAGLQGSAGLALFWSYLADLELADRGHAAAILERGLLAVTATAPPVGLWDGCAGVRWVLAHLADRDVVADAVAALDTSLATAIESEPWLGRLDLYHGLAGIALVYADDPSATGRRIVRRALKIFEQADWDARRDGNGMAHGIAGVLSVLTHHDGALHVIERLADQLVMQSQRDGATHLRWEGAAQGWCHGLAGIALALLAAARVLKRDDLRSAAIAAARAGTAIDETLSLDACLCHGSSGLAHLANRLYQITGDDMLAHHARFWLRRTMALARPDTGSQCGGEKQPSHPGGRPIRR